MFKRFRAVGWKNLTVEGVDLGRVNLVVGPNNCGKTNLMEAFGLLERLRSDPLLALEPMLSRLPEHITAAVADRRSGAARPISLGWRWSADSGGTANLRLDFSVGSPDKWPAALAVAGVLATLDGYAVRGWNEEGDVPEVKSTKERKEAKASFVGSCSTRSLRLPQVVRRDVDAAQKTEDSEPKLRHDAANLVHHLRALELSTDGIDPLSARIREGIAGLERLWVMEGGGFRWLQLKISRATYNLSEVSDGTLSLIILATVLFGSTPCTMLAIDEPELNLHPSWLKLVGRWLQRFTSPRQVMVATHSPDLLDTFTEGFRAGDVKLLVFDADGNLRNVEPAALDAKLDQGWELGDLYRVGDPDLGGWPW